MPWYLYISNTFPIDICNPNNYLLVGNSPPICPYPKQRLCAIQASDSLGLPIINTTLICQIANAVHNNLENVNVLLRPA